MSQHIIQPGPAQPDRDTGRWEGIKWVFGWDQPLQSFYLQKHDVYPNSEDDAIVFWAGATVDTKMYEVEDLVRVAKKQGLEIPYELQVKLYGEKDDGV